MSAISLPLTFSKAIAYITCYNVKIHVGFSLRNQVMQISKQISQTSHAKSYYEMLHKIPMNNNNKKFQ